MKNISLISFVGLMGAVVSLGSCGEATLGFNASDSYEIVMPDEGAIAIPIGFAFMIYPIKVMIPAEEAPGLGTSEGDSIPANNIQLFLNCFNCDFYDNPTGPRIPDTADMSGYVQVSNPYLVKTDDHGQFTILVRLFSPGNFGLETYNADVGAYAGSVNSVGTISVSSE